MKNKDKILVVLSRFPYPLEKGDKLRAYHQLKDLSKEFDVILVALTDKQTSEKALNAVRQVCSELHVERISTVSKLVGMITALLNGKPIQTGYFFRKRIANKIKLLVQYNDVKHIYCQLIRTSEYTKNIHSITKTLDYMDALSAGIERRIDLQPWYKKWVFRLEAKRLKTYERQVFDYFENKIIISEQDKNLISHPDKQEIVSIANGVDDQFFEHLPRPEEYEFVFVGNMSYPPNIEAVQYIADKILPHFKDAKLLISGATPHATIQQLADKNAQIHLLGWIDDIRSSYLNGKIFLAPMMIGTGMQNKLLEAMALKTPCITTSLANDAISMKEDEEIIVANTESEMIKAIKMLLSDSSKRKDIAEKAFQKVQRDFRWSETDKQLISLIQASIESKNEQ